ncbi:MAG: DUF1385 domain-containing protein [Clostridia bacterium]|nr:DUF1385 domain-containing protein [Clostridia bacterium]
MKKENANKCCHMTSIGGQAVIEGVMMKGPEKIATAVRKSSGEIVMDEKEVKSFITKYKLNKIPILRGVLAFIDSMVTGVKCLMFSADQVDLEDDDKSYEPSKFEKWLDNKFGDKVKDIAIYFAVAVSLVFSILLFMILPTVIAGFFANFIKNRIGLNLIEGTIKITIFLLYLWGVAHMNDIKRVFEYHGAEHKTIAAYEAGVELTPENAKNYSRLHPRCGTSFLLIVMVISILMFSLFSWKNVWIRIGYRLLLLPVVAGVSYEIIKIAGKRPNGVVGLLTKPGLWLQKLTTREPDEQQLEVAIKAMLAVIPQNKEDDKW